MYSQPYDYFPLNYSEKKVYNYYEEYHSYYHYPYDTLGWEDDYYLNSGKISYVILDSTFTNDTTIAWLIRETLDYSTIKWELDSNFNRDTTYSTTLDSTEYFLYEYTNGLHKVSTEMNILNLEGEIYRFSNENLDSINYRIPDNNGYLADHTLRRNIGLCRIYCNYGFSGNFSYHGYLKDVELIDSLSTSVIDENIITKFYLSQNFPNPFNPTTTIKFGIPKSANVTLKIYDITGSLVRTLLNENISRGIYSVKFNAENIASGVYFYRLTVGNFSKTKKFLYLK